jgi:Transposase
MSTTVKNSRMARRYGEDFKRQAVELMIHSGKRERQVARELDVSEYSLNLWKKAYLRVLVRCSADQSGSRQSIILHGIFWCGGGVTGAVSWLLIRP